MASEGHGGVGPIQGKVGKYCCNHLGFTEQVSEHHQTEAGEIGEIKTISGH